LCSKKSQEFFVDFSDESSILHNRLGMRKRTGNCYRLKKVTNRTIVQIVSDNKSERLLAKVQNRRSFKVCSFITKTGLTIRKIQIVGTVEVFFLDILFYRTDFLKPSVVLVV